MLGPALPLQIVNLVNRLSALICLLMLGVVDRSKPSSKVMINATFAIRICVTITAIVYAVFVIPEIQLAFNRRYAIADILASAILLMQDLYYLK